MDWKGVKWLVWLERINHHLESSETNNGLSLKEPKLVDKKRKLPLLVYTIWDPWFWCRHIPKFENVECWHSWSKVRCWPCYADNAKPVFTIVFEFSLVSIDLYPSHVGVFSTQVLYRSKTVLLILSPFLFRKSYTLKTRRFWMQKRNIGYALYVY